MYQQVNPFSVAYK